ncbi:MAG: hypothetical protein WDO69_24370 [Pseudomonadota bacterium]
MLETIKRIMGLKKSRRPALNLEKLHAPVEASRLKLEAAHLEHAATLEQASAHAKELAEATAAFDADGGGSNADRVIAARREAKRHGMFTERTQRLVDRAAAAHQEAQATHDRIVLETLDSVYANASKHMIAEWEATGKPALMAFSAFIREVDTITSEAEQAVRESSAIRGDDNAWMKVRGLEAQSAAISETIVHELGYPTVERLARVLRF